VTAHSRGERTVLRAHPLPGPAPASGPAEAKIPVYRPESIIAAGWVAFIAGVAALVAGLAGAPVGSLIAGIVLLAVAGTAAAIDPAPERAALAARRLKALLLSGLTERGPF
jgi:hypothetical protein